MFVSKTVRVCGASFGLLALTVAVSCSDSASPAGSGGGSAGQPSVTAGNTGLAGASAGGGAGNSGGDATNAGSAGTGTGGAGGEPGVGGTGGAGGAAGGTAGEGGSGGGPDLGAFVPCNTAPAETPPALRRGPAITGFPGMLTAGQMVGVPGEPGLLYVIGHRDGNVFVVQNGTVLQEPLVEVDVASGGNNEQGLLSMALHPSFATNRLFYLFYTATGGGAMTIDEFERTTPTSAVFKQNIYSRPRDGGGAFHNGGSITFNPKDEVPSLYFSVGNNEGNNAGNPTGVAGRVLRIDVASKMFTTFSYGLRNPYRMSVDRLTGDMYIADVANGPGGTVIFSAFGEMGQDYGYRNNNGNPDVNDGILRDSAGAAIIGGYVYRGNKIPGLCGRYFYGNHNGGTVKSIVVQNGQRVGNAVTHGTLSVPGNITSFGEDGEGELYMASMSNTIYKIEPAD